MQDAIQKQNELNETCPRPQVQPDEGAVELCFALPPVIADMLAAYTRIHGCSSDEAATRAIAMLLKQTDHLEELAQIYAGHTAPFPREALVLVAVRCHIQMDGPRWEVVAKRRLERAIAELQRGVAA